MKKQAEQSSKQGMLFLVAAVAVLFTFAFVLAANPVNPDKMAYGSNLTKADATSKMVNLSGGRILTINLTATIQNPRWKAFVGDVVATFTLDDDNQHTIFDWTLDSISGRVYASRTNTVVWTGIKCAQATDLNVENVEMSHAGSSDNITSTFRNVTHEGFSVGAEVFIENYCNYTLNTYGVGGVQDVNYDEVALVDTGANLVYATIISEGATGFDGRQYDFQMIVPENGSSSFVGATPYYLYVEITN